MISRYRDKYDSEAVYDPADALDAQGDGLPDVPPVVLLGSQNALTDAVRERASERVDIVRSQSCYRLSETVGFVPVGEVERRDDEQFTIRRERAPAEQPRS